MLSNVPNSMILSHWFIEKLMWNLLVQQCGFSYMHLIYLGCTVLMFFSLDCYLWKKKKRKPCELNTFNMIHIVCSQQADCFSHYEAVSNSDALQLLFLFPNFWWIPCTLKILMQEYEDGETTASPKRILTFLALVDALLLCFWNCWYFLLYPFWSHSACIHIWGYIYLCVQSFVCFEGI